MWALLHIVFCRGTSRRHQFAATRFWPVLRASKQQQQQQQLWEVRTTIICIYGCTLKIFDLLHHVWLKF
jgi:hypothetical protein